MELHAKLDVSSLPTKETVRQAVQKAVIEAINKEVGGVIYPETQMYVPVNTGALKASGRYIEARATGESTVSASIEYGNDEVYYAVYVHEELENQHMAPTMAKFVEIPLAKHAGEIKTAIRTAVLKGIAQAWPSGTTGSNSDNSSGMGMMGSGMELNSIDTMGGGTGDVGEVEGGISDPSSMMREDF